MLAHGPRPHDGTHAAWSGRMSQIGFDFIAPGYVRRDLRRRAQDDSRWSR